MSRRSKFSRTVLLAAALLAVAASILTFKIWRAREDAIDEATRGINNFSAILAEQVSNAAETIDASLEAIVAHADRTDTFVSSASSREFDSLLADRLSKIPHADVITIADAQGVVIASTRGVQRHPGDLSDREHFKALSRPGASGLFVSAPLIDRVTGDWAVYFARRIESVAGAFLGIAVIGVKPEGLVQTQHALDLIEGHSFSLFRSNGVLLFRRPAKLQTIGKVMPASSEWYDVVKRGGGLYHSPGYFEGSPRFVAARPLARFPFVVTVTISDDAALGTWRTRSIAIALFGVVGLGLLGLLLRQLAVQYERLRVSREGLRVRELHLAQQSRDLAESNRRFDAALTHMSQGLAMYDDAGRLVVGNQRYAELYGLSRADLRPGMSLADVLALRVQAGVYAQGSAETYLSRADEPLVARERLDRLTDGRTIRVNRRVLPDGGWITVHEDVTEQAESVSRIAHMALHDGLTGLSNRSHFLQKLAERRRETAAAAVLLIDLDAFKAVNDLFGHAVGDALLVKVGERLRRIAGQDMVARLGGDEFAVLQDCAGADCSAAIALAARLMAEVSRIYRIDGREISIGLCVGIETVGVGEVDVQGVMRRADLALYAAKSAGRNRYAVFEGGMERAFEARTKLALDLKLAIERQQLELYYQPIVSVATCEIVAMEALLRWRRADGTMVAPDVFVPLAEQEGLINAIGAWALRRACADAAQWPENVRVAVNVSALQIETDGFVDVVRAALESAKLGPERLEIEITESVLLNQGDRNLEVLGALQRAGVSIALDDFGSGYSSLSYLKRFAFDMIKIDKSFVDDVTTHAGCATLVAATTSLARGFDIATTAEGVETLAQFEALRAASVTLMQGYLFGKPRPIEDWRPILDRRVALTPRQAA